MLRGSMRYGKGLYGALGVFWLFSVCVIAAGWFTSMGASSGNYFERIPTWISIVAVVGAFGTVIVGILQGARGLLAEMEGDYVFAALTRAQREEAYMGLFRSPETHRFQGKIANPERIIRVLSIHRDGTVSVEPLSAGQLINEHSAPLDDVNGVGELDDDEDLDGDVEDEPLTPEEERFERVMDQVLDRLTHGAKHPDVESYDIFWDGDKGDIHLVSIGSADYLHFPEDLAAELRSSL